jgi:ATP-binding cassette, subfamily B, bacterial
MQKHEFTVTEAYPYDRSGLVRWIGSHAMRYPLLPLGTILLGILSTILGSQAPLYLGRTFDHVLSPERNVRTLLSLSLAVIGFKLSEAALDALHRVVGEYLSRRIQRNARDELYTSLLGKSLSFHSRQRIGDLMTRAADDVRGLNYLFSPGLRVAFTWLAHLIVPLVAIGSIHAQLLLVPAVQLIAMAAAIWRYARRIKPVADAQRDRYGKMNADLAESISGIEVVKGSAQEAQERKKFRANARHFRDLRVRHDQIQAAYLPGLVQRGALALGFAHAMVLFGQGTISVGSAIAFVGLLGSLGFPDPGIPGVIVWGATAAERILSLVNAETDLDENQTGVERPMRGDVVFEDVSFAYEEQPVLQGIRFHAHPGETVAIVGQTGSGKTTLTRMINRIYDATSGRVRVDGIDVRDWKLSSLRSQISTIEQDVFLFSRSIADNIAFGAGRPVGRKEIERCAREAQADEFIDRLQEGYDTVVGERGVILSGGQRQRIAIARAFLSDPRILLLDDATSAIDSATEDRIRTAMHRVSQGRTTFLITHRLSQIRWADRILVLQRGALVAQGTHDELIRRCAPYRRIFARARADLPPMETKAD